MNVAKKMLAAGMLIASAASFANTELAAQWGVAQLKQAQEASLVFVKAEKGQAVLDAVYGFSIERTTQGNAARARVLYLDSGVKKALSLFCHEHEAGEIDCH